MIRSLVSPIFSLCILCGASAAQTDTAASSPTPTPAATATPTPAAETPAPSPSPTPDAGNTLFTRAVVGIDMAGGSSLATQQHFFVEANITAPLRLRKIDDDDRLAAEACINRINEVSHQLRVRLATTRISENVSDFLSAGGHLGRMRGDCGDAKWISPESWKRINNASNVEAFEAAAAVIRKKAELKYSPLASRWWVWINPRISAIPSQASNLLTTVSTSSPSVNSLLTTQYNQAIQDFELLGGMEFNTGRWSTFGGATLGVSLIASAGFSTPLSATASNAQIFNIPASPSPTLQQQLANLGVSHICGTAGNPASPPGCTNAVGFVPLDRTHFFYQEYVGIRFKTYYFKSRYASEVGGLCPTKRPGQVCPIFPGTYDVTVGQNSAYTGGALHGWLLRTEAFYPLPFNPAFHFFFTAWIHVTERNQNTTPLILDTASSSTTLSTAGVQQVALAPLNRDFYRIGVGVDLVQFIKKLKNSSSQQAVQ